MFQSAFQVEYEATYIDDRKFSEGNKFFENSLRDVFVYRAPLFIYLYLLTFAFRMLTAKVNSILRKQHCPHHWECFVIFFYPDLSFTAVILLRVFAMVVKEKW